MALGAGAVPRCRGRKRSKTMVVHVSCVVGGLIFAIVVGVILYRNALTDKEQEFRLRCINRKQVMKAEMANSLNTSFVIVGLLNVVEEINEQSWLAFTTYSEYLRPNVRTLFYMQRVLDQDRAAFEKKWNSPILGFDPNLNPKIRAKDTEYAPILFIARQVQNITMMDPMSIPIIRTAVERARDTGSMSMSAPDKYRGIWRIGVYLPFYGHDWQPLSLSTVDERRQGCLGYVGVSLDIYDLFSAVLSRYEDDINMDLSAAYVPQKSEDYLPSHNCTPADPECDVLIYGNPLRQGEKPTALISWTFGFQSFNLKCYAKYNIHVFALRSIIAWPLLMMIFILLSSIIVSLVMKRLQAVQGDVTEMEKLNQDLKVAKQAAEAADKAKSSFLATVSHEIRTPMNGMIGMTNLLLGTDLTTQQLEYVKIAQQSGNALIALINDVLDLSKIEAGGMELESVTFDLRLEIDDVLSLFEDKVQQKNIEVSALVHDSVPTCLVGDPGRLRQVLINLVGNAIKFTKQGSIFLCVRLVDESWQGLQAENSSVSSLPSVDSASRLLPLSYVLSKPDSTAVPNDSHTEEDLQKPAEDSEFLSFPNDNEVAPRLSMRDVTLNNKESIKKWRNWQPSSKMDSSDGSKKLKLIISVEDTGIGIPSHLHHRLFKPFLQANSGTAREYGGTGIGLSISQKLVTLMHGELSVESQPGEGSTFEFTLTLLNGLESNLSRSHRSEAQEDRLKGVKVILVDNHFIRREVAVTYLRKLGVLVEACEDAGVAETLVQRNDRPLFQAAIVDFHKSEIESVLSFARSVRSKPGLQAFPLISLTSQLNKVERLELEKAGFAHTLHNPLRHTTLAAALLRVLGLKSQVPSRSVNPYAQMLMEKRVLVVDDNQINRKVASSMLARYGALVVCVNGGSEALDAVKKEPGFDLILMDIQMPEMDGYEATRRIRQWEIDSCNLCQSSLGNEPITRSCSNGRESEGKVRVVTCPHHQIPVVAVTADVMKGTHELCLNAGMDDYIPKPLDQRQLHSLLERFLKNDLVNRRGTSVQGNRSLQSSGHCHTRTSKDVIVEIIRY